MNTDLMFSSKTDLWSTPQYLFDELDKEFHFTLDPCADETNHKCEKYYTKEQDGLIQDWQGETVFCNPPYGNKETGLWTKKCYEESLKKDTTVVLLIPARTDRISFHEYIYGKAEIRFIKGRLKFGDGKNTAPFPSMVVVFRNKKETMVNAHEFIEHLLKQQEKPSDLLEIINRGCAIYEMRKFIGEIEEGAQHD